jgi:hypothetical protein
MLKPKMYRELVWRERIMRKLFALAAVLVLTASMSGCESCSLFRGERARPYPTCVPAYEPGCAAPCGQGCAPGYAPAGGCPSCAPTIGAVSTTTNMPGGGEVLPGPQT